MGILRFRLIQVAFGLLVLVIVSFLIFRLQGRDKSENIEFAKIPTMEEFSVHDVFLGIPAIPDWGSNPDALTFRTRISEGAKNGPNFAGKYTVITWGCGTSCQASAIINSESGKIVAFGLLSARDIRYDLHSSLLIVNPKENLHPQEIEDLSKYEDEHFPLGSTPATADYYVMKDDSLTFIGKYHVLTGESPICIQVVVNARNPLTNKIEQFGNPCSVPFGWEALEAREIVD